jgi:hypothetical protein
VFGAPWRTSGAGEEVVSDAELVFVADPVDAELDGVDVEVPVVGAATGGTVTGEVEVTGETGAAVVTVVGEEVGAWVDWPFPFLFPFP